MADMTVCTTWRRSRLALGSRHSMPIQAGLKAAQTRAGRQRRPWQGTIKRRQVAGGWRLAAGGWQQAASKAEAVPWGSPC